MILPGCQVYVEAPEATKFILLFKQIEFVELGEMLMADGLFTVTVTVFDLTHPLAVMPVTVYVVVTVGETTIDVPLPEGNQVYPDPLLAVSVELNPLHILAGEAETPIVLVYV